MLLFLFDFFSESFGPLRVFEYLSFRSILATITSLIFSLLLGPLFINKMKQDQQNQIIRESGPESHLDKKGTPTMGGLMILLGIFSFGFISLNFSVLTQKK